MVRSHKWTRAAGALLGSAAVLLAAGAPVGAKAAKPVIQIGADVSLTGQFSNEGKEILDGYQFWANQVNRSGGIRVGHTRYDVHLIVRDDQSNPQTAAKITQELITQDHVRFLLGPYSSAITMATSTIGEKYNVITIASEANAPSIYTRGYKDVFSILRPATQIFANFFRLARQEGAKTVAIMARDDPFGLAVAAGAQREAVHHGLKVIYDQKYSPNATDLSGELTAIKALHPDVLVASSLEQDSILVVKQAQSLRVNVKMMGFASGPEIPSFEKALGKNANFVYGVPWWLPSLKYKDSLYGWTPATYARAFEKVYHLVPDYHPASGTVAGEVLQAAIQKAGSLATDKVRAALHHLDLMTFWGPIGFNKNGESIRGNAVVIQVQKDRIVPVYPPANALAKPIYPMPPWGSGKR